MNLLKRIITLNLLLAVLQTNATAQIIQEWTSGNYEIGSGKEWDTISELTTRNDVTVTMFEGGGVGLYWMWNSSSLTMNGGSVVYLYLYNNAMATFFGLSYMNELYIDPASAAQVKLYADFDRWEPHGLYSEGTLYGNWLSNQTTFQFDLLGYDAYSHVQFIPEPATVVLLGLGSLAVLRRHR